jgi:hypothetical protein
LPFWKTGFPMNMILVDSKPWFLSSAVAMVVEASSFVEVTKTVVEGGFASIC